MGRGSDWLVVPAGPGTVAEVESGVSEAAGPAVVASPKIHKFNQQFILTSLIIKMHCMYSSRPLGCGSLGLTFNIPCLIDRYFFSENTMGFIYISLGFNSL